MATDARSRRHAAVLAAALVAVACSGASVKTAGTLAARGRRGLRCRPLCLRGGSEEEWLDAAVRSWRELSSPPPAAAGTAGTAAPARQLFELELDVAAPRGGRAASAAPYAPGDCVAVRAPNPPDVVAALVGMLAPHAPGGGGGGEDMAPASSSGDAGDPVVPPTYPPGLRQLLRARLAAAELAQVIWERDLCSLTKVSLRGLAVHCAAADEAGLLRTLAASQPRFSAHIQTPAITIVELLEALPSCRPALSDLLAALPPLTPRYYSISSSPLQYNSASACAAAGPLSSPPATVALTFAFVLVNRTLPRDAGAGSGMQFAAQNGTGVGNSSDLRALLSRLALARAGGPGSAPCTRAATEGGVVYRPGHCTGFLRALCDLVSGDGRRAEESAAAADCRSRPPELRRAHLKVALKSADKFQLPGDPRTPMVLVGFGTGLAPFLGFLWHRRLSPPAPVCMQCACVRVCVCVCACACVGECMCV